MIEHGDAETLKAYAEAADAVYKRLAEKGTRNAPVSTAERRSRGFAAYLPLTERKKPATEGETSCDPWDSITAAIDSDIRW